MVLVEVLVMLLHGDDDGDEIDGNAVVVIRLLDMTSFHIQRTLLN